MSSEGQAPLTFCALSTTYSVELQVEQLLRVLDLDREDIVPLFVRLGKLEGIRMVDYDGHFGPFVFLTIDTDADTEDTKNAVTACIQEYLAQ